MCKEHVCVLWPWYSDEVFVLSLLQMIGAYSVSKTALLGLTKALAPELSGSNIRVNCLAPGVIRTKFSRAVSEKEGGKEREREERGEGGWR